jgi:hypothetical protein
MAAMTPAILLLPVEGNQNANVSKLLSNALIRMPFYNYTDYVQHTYRELTAVWLNL